MPATCSNGHRPGRPQPRVVAGTLAKKLLAPLGVRIGSHVIQLGSVRVPDGIRPGPDEVDQVDQSEVRCFDSDRGGRDDRRDQGPGQRG